MLKKLGLFLRNTKKIIYLGFVKVEDMDNYKLKLSTKKLRSGKCQVRFELSQEAPHGSWYGYILSEGDTPLREVIQAIYKKARLIKSGDGMHDHLFHLERRGFHQQPLFLFKN